MNCHAKVRILTNRSALLIGKKVGVVKVYRKSSGLWRASTSEANKALAIQSGRARRDMWGSAKNALQTRKATMKSRPEQHLAVAWRDEMMELRRLERATSWANHPEAKIQKKVSMDWYWKNLEEARRRGRVNAGRRYERLKHDPEYRLKIALRNSISRICRKSKTKKTRKTIEYLGCTISEARLHIERQFERGMTWRNRGEWEIHHIIPLAEWDLSRPEQRMRANHFTNLKPVWRSVNRAIGARMIGEHQMALL
jgi:hypothetical protein